MPQGLIETVASLLLMFFGLRAAKDVLVNLIGTRVRTSNHTHLHHHHHYDEAQDDEIWGQEPHASRDTRRRDRAATEREFDRLAERYYE